jgi:hypothetical protein
MIGTANHVGKNAQGQHLIEAGITQHSLHRQNLRTFARIYFLNSNAGSLDKQIEPQLPLEHYGGARDPCISPYQRLTSDDQQAPRHLGSLSANQRPSSSHAIVACSTLDSHSWDLQPKEHTQTLYGYARLRYFHDRLPHVAA